jgi:hypothetical protein
VVEAAAKRLGEEVRSELETLRDKLNDEKVARGVVAPALLLLQAERLGVDETALRYFGAVISGAIGGDGSVSAAEGKVVLASGKREIALLWGAVLAAHGIKAKVRDGRGFNVAASGVGAARLAGLYFLFGPPLLEEDERVINHKLAEAVRLGAEGLDIRWEGLRRTEGGPVAADLIISVGGAAVKYNVYLRGDAVELQFASTDRSRVELAARLLRLAGVRAEVKKVGDGGVWRIWVATNRLVAGHEKLRKALVEFVKTAHDNGWVEAGKADGWLEELEKGRVLREGRPEYHVGLDKGGLKVRYHSTNPDSIKREAQRLREIGLEEGKHFSVKMPEGGKVGYVSVLKEGLAHAAWLSVHGTEGQRDLAADFVKYILERAEKAGEKVSEKATKIVEEGMSRGSLKLEGFEVEVEVNGEKRKVKVIDGEAVEEDRDGRKLLRIKITAEVGRVEGEHTIVDRVEREYTITYSRRGAGNAAVGYAYVRADAPEVREADAERLAAVVKAITGKEPRIIEKNDGTIEAVYGSAHLKGFMRYAELADAIEKWLEETGRR